MTIAPGRDQHTPARTAPEVAAAVALVAATVSLFGRWVHGGGSTAIALLDTDESLWAKASPLFVLAATVTGVLALVGLRSRRSLGVGPRGAALAHLVAAVTVARTMIELADRASPTLIGTLVALLAGTLAWWLRAGVRRRTTTPTAEAVTASGTSREPVHTR